MMQDVAVNLVAVIVLLAINGFFVASEFALVKARGFRVETLAEGGHRGAALTLRIQRELEAYLAACQLGITMASLGLGWVGEPAVAALLEPTFRWAGVPDHVLHGSAFVVGFLLFSSLHIVVGEQVPKTFAIRKAEPVSLWVAYPLHLSYLLAYPLNRLLNSATRWILQRFGVQEVTHADVLSGEELKGLVAVSREHGQIEPGKAEMLHNLFEFDQRHVGRVMIPRGSIQALDTASPPEQNLQTIRDSGHSRFPVINGGWDNIVGLVLAKDLYAAMLSGEREPWRDLNRYCREPLIVPESQRVSRLFDTMRAHRAHMVFVVDEYGALTGIVTLEDLLEEIVGDIRDETDVIESQPGIIPVNGHWEADGLIPLADLERAIGLKVPVELDANTVSGLCMQRLKHMPKPGDVFAEGAFVIRVMAVKDRRVGRVQIEKRVSDDQTPSEMEATRDEERAGEKGSE